MDTYNYIKNKSNFFQYIDRYKHQYRIYSRKCSEQSKMLVIPEYKLENPGNILAIEIVGTGSLLIIIYFYVSNS